MGERRTAHASGTADRAGRPRHRRPRGWGLATVTVCLVGGLLLGTAWSTSGGRDLDSRSADLYGVVQDARGRVDAAAARAADLERQVEQAGAVDLGPQVTKARGSVAELAPAAGMTAVSGPGVRVTLSDAPRDADGEYPADVDPDDLVVHQQDLQSAVNALWAGGAEAMMIMDQRVINTSAVRCIGNTLLLQGRAYSPPFVVTAIGNQDLLTQALTEAPGVRLFQRYVDAYGLGLEVERVSALTMPGYEGVVRLTAVGETTR